MNETEGGNAVDAGGGVDVEAGTPALTTLRHTLSQGSPAMHTSSPAYPSQQAYIDVVLESEVSEAAWLNTMPTAIKTWVQQQGSGDRVLLRLQNQGQLALWRLAAPQV